MTMFWRILYQLIRVSRTRLLLALAAVVSGAAVSSALLNIHFDAERKLTQEFTALGPNVVISARSVAGAAGDAAPLADQSLLPAIAQAAGRNASVPLPFLYFVGRMHGRAVIVAGTVLADAAANLPWLKFESHPGVFQPAACFVGARAAAFFGGAQAPLELGYAEKKFICQRVAIFSSGGPEDNQVLIPLADAQNLIGRAARISLAQLRIKGSAQDVEEAVAGLARALPGMEVRPIRQIAQAEGQILSRIRALIFATVALILALTALCVLSTMTALALEHRRDVGLMKALGGEMHRVLRLFLVEIAALGVVGGLLGWFAGVWLSAWVGRQVFASAIAPRAEVLPLTVALMTGVALAGAFPLRLLSRVRPAVILRGE
jgi:putative ABC transport system permease protein